MLISNESPPCTTVVFGVWGWVMQVGEWEGQKWPLYIRRKREAFETLKQAGLANLYDTEEAVRKAVDLAAGRA